MNAKSRKLMSLILMVVFAVKMSISLAPLFTFLDSGTAKAVIMQLEQESKGEKENAEKDALKEKKTFDEHLLAIFHFDPFLIETNYLHNQEHALLVQLYHPVVPTPPPNA
ncbi:hypothetical protein ACFS5N_14280 [Mucilaginibacter ximonensis]|uniref:Uncharacterized protein n=1 Tax=Mucilaginibacter ximonensis TaxID=538021 RepID=A0ABW5YF45_9SPHI